MSIVFTRYLYEKHYVLSALTLSLLNYQKDAALFWAYELFYSGFVEEVYHHIIALFYDYYYLLNASFEKYLLNIVDHGMAEDISIYLIIVNLLKRKYTIDILLLKTFAFHWENELIQPTSGEDIIHIVEHYDDGLVDLSMWLFKDALVDFENILLDSMKCLLQSKGLPNKLLKDLHILFQSPYLSHLHKKQAFIGRLILLLKEVKQGRPIYIHKVENEEEILHSYQTKYDHTNMNEDTQPHEVLLKETRFGMNDDGMEYLSLFHINQNDVQCALFQNWESHAYLTPLWRKRFAFYGASMTTTREMQFNNAEYEEYFYEWYAYCPDEQGLEIQQKLLHQRDPNLSVTAFLMKYGKLNVLQTNLDLIF